LGWEEVCSGFGILLHWKFFVTTFYATLNFFFVTTSNYIFFFCNYLKLHCFLFLFQIPIFVIFFKSWFSYFLLFSHFFTRFLLIYFLATGNQAITTTKYFLPNVVNHSKLKKSCNFFEILFITFCFGSITLNLTNRDSKFPKNQ